MAEEFNFSLLWGGGGLSHDRKRNNPEQLAKKYIAQKIDGVFFAPLELTEGFSERNDRIIVMFNKAGIPIVLLDTYTHTPPVTENLDLVGINNIEAGYIVAKHLIDSRCKKIIFITCNNVAKTVLLRIQGAGEAVSQSSKKIKFTVKEIESDVSAFIENEVEGKKFDGMICYNDAAAGSIMIELNNRNIKIPQEIKVAAFDDVKYARMLKVPLTTYQQPCSAIGTAAVETIISRLRNSDFPARQVLIKGKLIIRQSTAV
jgi:DNA-binding LacI/PurR family transcriptional regulator